MLEGKKKLELMEILIKRLAKLAQIHDTELRDLVAATEVAVWILPESHPAVEVIKDRYQAYMEWVEVKKMEALSTKRGFHEHDGTSTGTTPCTTGKS